MFFSTRHCFVARFAFCCIGNNELFLLVVFCAVLNEPGLVTGQARRQAGCTSYLIFVVPCVEKDARVTEHVRSSSLIISLFLLPDTVLYCIPSAIQLVAAVVRYTRRGKSWW